MYITITGKGPLPKIPTRKLENPDRVSQNALRIMNKSMKIYLERINQELYYSESLAKDMPKVRKFTK